MAPVRRTRVKKNARKVVAKPRPKARKRSSPTKAPLDVLERLLADRLGGEHWVARELWRIRCDGRTYRASSDGRMLVALRVRAAQRGAAKELRLIPTKLNYVSTALKHADTPVPLSTLQALYDDRKFKRAKSQLAVVISSMAYQLRFIQIVLDALVGPTCPVKSTLRFGLCPLYQIMDDVPAGGEGKSLLCFSSPEGAAVVMPMTCLGSGPLSKISFPPLEGC